MKVLVVDDDRVSLLIAESVVEQSGHTCMTAADGDAAWRLFNTHHPEVVVTDWMMPGLDGLALCRAIRADPWDAYTYLILVTSLGTQDDILAGTQAGADDYVTKPLDPFTLRARLLVADRVTALHAQLGRYREDLSEQARTDPLTKLHNRLKLTEDLALLHSRSERYERDYSVALCDIDEFKHYNDTYGHQAGDEALRAVAQTLAGQARRNDSVYRYGGEEFLLLLPELAAPAAGAAVERLRKAAENLEIQHSGSAAGVLTLSAGISSYVPGHRLGAEQLLKEADLAMYAAKAAGRNQVSVAVLGPDGAAEKGVASVPSDRR